MLATTPEGLERRELIQRVGTFRGATERGKDEALRLLEDVGWIRADSNRYRKDSPTRYAVNP